MIIMMTVGRSLWLIECPDEINSNQPVRATCKVGHLADYSKLVATNVYYSKAIPIMKVRDLPKETKLDGLKLRSPKGVIGYYMGEGHCIVYLGITPEPIEAIEARGDETRLYPQIINDNQDIKEWDVITDKDVRVNCADLVSHKYTLCIDDTN
jgi:hypothetical protein